MTYDRVATPPRQILSRDARRRLMRNLCIPVDQIERLKSEGRVAPKALYEWIAAGRRALEASNAGDGPALMRALDQATWAAEKLDPGRAAPARRRRDRGAGDAPGREAQGTRCPV